jgi:HAD superfamily hydrolase (TIGR01509 family)
MRSFKAVIFDMDGVIIDSEPLWRKAMIAGFNDIGIDFTEEDCRKTTGMRFKEVIAHWFAHHDITEHSQEELDYNVITHLIELINIEGKPMTGLMETLKILKEKNYKVGLATSSNNKLVEAVLNKLQIHHYFSAITSAEHLQFGKPHPEVFLNCAHYLQTAPKDCIVIEDSINGIIGAKAAQMQVVAIPDAQHADDPLFVLADHNFNNLLEFIKLL